MNRAQAVQALAACNALAGEIRKALNADALAEFEEQGCAPSWRMRGYTVTTAVTRDAVRVTDDEAFLAYVAEVAPTEVETITTTRVRPAWQARFLAEVVKRGEPAADEDGRIVPGLAFVPGGEFDGVSVRPESTTKAALTALAADIAAGRRPLALPSAVEVLA